MRDIKGLTDLPEAQQKILAVILRTKKPTIRTSDLLDREDGDVSGKSIGGVLGSLYRNGYLEKISGGRDKVWRLSDVVQETRVSMQKELDRVKQYWD